MGELLAQCPVVAGVAPGNDDNVASALLANGQLKMHGVDRSECDKVASPDRGLRTAETGTAADG